MLFGIIAAKTLEQMMLMMLGCPGQSKLFRQALEQMMLMMRG